MAEFRASWSPSKLFVFTVACSNAVFVPVNACTNFSAPPDWSTSVCAAIAASRPNISVVSVMLIFLLARFSSAVDKPTTLGLKFVSVASSSFRSTFLSPVPASAPFMPPAASNCSAVLVSSKDSPAALAAAPTFFKPSDTSAMLDAPNLEPAAKTLINLLASSAPAPNWLRDVPNTFAASVKSIVAASAKVTALRVTAFKASLDSSRSGFADAISLKAVAACEADSVVVRPISIA